MTLSIFPIGYIYISREGKFKGKKTNEWQIQHTHSVLSIRFFTQTVLEILTKKIFLNRSKRKHTERSYKSGSRKERTFVFLGTHR